MLCQVQQHTLRNEMDQQLMSRVNASRTGPSLKLNCMQSKSSQRWYMVVTKTAEAEEKEKAASGDSSVSGQLLPPLGIAVELNRDH